MSKQKNYQIKNLNLADQGEKNIDWARSQMTALEVIKKRFFQEKPFKNIAIGIALHITKETAVLVETLLAGGAQVAIASCNPLSTQDDVAAKLAKQDVAVFGWKGETNQEYYRNLQQVVEFLQDKAKNGYKLTTIDDGCDLISLIHQKYTDLIPHLIVGTEETTTGVIRLRAMEKEQALKYPVIAVNDNKTKHLFDNYYGTGQSTIDGIIRASSILFAGKTVVIAGYGPCGQGIAKVARGLGSSIIICEVDPIRGLQAKMDGFTIMAMKDAAKIGDIFITVTGDINVITKKEMLLMKNGVVLANSGHFDVEININDLKKLAKTSKLVRPGFDQYLLKNGQTLYLCGQGRLVNLACAEGHPSMVMSQSFCGQALATEYGIKNKLSIAVHILPEKIDRQIAELQLAAMDVTIDKLTSEQKKYLSSWQIGT